MAAQIRARNLRARRQWQLPPQPFGTPPSPRTRALIERAKCPVGDELVKFASTSSPVHAELVRLSCRASRAFKLGQYEQAVSIYSAALHVCEREGLPSAQRALFWSNRACARVRLRHRRSNVDATQDAERAKAAALPSERAQYHLALIMVKAKDPRLSVDVSTACVTTVFARSCDSGAFLIAKTWFVGGSLSGTPQTLKATSHSHPQRSVSML